MPNYVYNKIEFKGEEASLNVLKEKMNGIVANNSKQIMGDLLGENSGGKDWYNHNIKCYGTQWDVRVENCFKLEINNDNIILEFDTAWCPPYIFLEEICKKYNIRSNAVYDDRIGDFMGIIKIDDHGEIMESNEWSYDEGFYRLNPEEFLKFFEYNIDHYVDQDWEYVPKSFDFLTVDDFNRINKIIQKRSIERLFDNPPLGSCFNNTYSINPQ
jgi:hypothetical protein